MYSRSGTDLVRAWDAHLDYDLEALAADDVLVGLGVTSPLGVLGRASGVCVGGGVHQANLVVTLPGRGGNQPKAVPVRLGSDRLLHMIEVGARSRSQPAPPWVLFEAISQPDRDPSRPWLRLLGDEVEPRVIEFVKPQLVVWSSLWTKRPDARVRFEISPDGSGCTVHWRLLVDEPEPEAAFLGHLRKRLNQLINADLRHSFGQ